MSLRIDVNPLRNFFPCRLSGLIRFSIIWALDRLDRLFLRAGPRIFGFAMNLFAATSRPLPLRQRFVAAFCAGWLLLTSLGIPLPLPVVAESTSPAGATPFPCQGHRCGCRTAEQCWRACCCMSLEARLAWARERGIEPPAELIAAAKETTAPRACCAARKKSCCASKEAPATAAPSNPEPPSGIVLAAWMQCRGLTAAWMASGAGLLPPPMTVLENYAPVAGQLESYDSLAVSAWLERDTPPPRWFSHV